MIMPNDPVAPCPCGPFGRDHDRRIDLEMAFGCRVDVGGGQYGKAAIGLPEQQPAPFTRRVHRNISADGIQQCP